MTRAAAILGSGPSLPADLAHLPDDCVLIGVNHHALRICDPEYVFFLDDPMLQPELFSGLKDYNGKKISPKPEWADVFLPKGAWWDAGFSAASAVWWALANGFDPVILCGMDCYQGETKYFYDRDFHHPCHDYPLEYHLRAWRKVFTHCPRPERVCAMSGPLVDVFGSYDVPLFRETASPVFRYQEGHE